MKRFLNQIGVGLVVWGILAGAILLSIGVGYLLKYDMQHNGFAVWVVVGVILGFVVWITGFLFE